MISKYDKKPRTILLRSKVLIMHYDWRRLGEFRGPAGVSLRWDALKRSETGLRGRLRPIVLKELVPGSRIHHLERRRGRYEPRGPKCRRLSRWGSIEELANELDVSFTGLACGCDWEIMKLVPEVSLLVESVGNTSDTPVMKKVRQSYPAANFYLLPCAS